MATILTVNSAHVRPGVSAATTGIDKRPIDGPIEVRAPGPQRGGLGSGLVGDTIGNPKFHGGDDQAVYAYAREDLDAWQTELDRGLENGSFGENVTTSGVDVTGAIIGERWRIGSSGLLLEVTRPRTPCKTFEVRLGLEGWMKTFTRGGAPGAYLRVLEPGSLQAGDDIEVVERPGHGVTIGTVFRAMMTEPDLLPEILVADALPEPIKPTPCPSPSRSRLGVAPRVSVSDRGRKPRRPYRSAPAAESRVPRRGGGPGRPARAQRRRSAPRRQSPRLSRVST